MPVCKVFVFYFYFYITKAQQLEKLKQHEYKLYISVFTLLNFSNC